MDVLYTAEAQATGGRDGRVTSSDGQIDLALVPPKEVGGPGGDGTNPEQLFAAGYGACFLSALKFAAAPHKLRTSQFTIDTLVSLERDDSGFFIAAELHGNLPDVDEQLARELMHTAHQGCPYSKATRGNIEVKLFLGDQPLD